MMKNILTLTIITMLSFSFLSASSMTQVNQNNIEELMHSSKPLIIDAYADWCGPCRQLADVFNELNADYGDQYHFVKLNVDNERSLSKKFGVQSIPTVIFIKDGKVLGTHVGFMSKAQFLEEINKHF